MIDSTCLVVAGRHLGRFLEAADCNRLLGDLSCPWNGCSTGLWVHGICRRNCHSCHGILVRLCHALYHAWVGDLWNNLCHPSDTPCHSRPGLSDLMDVVLCSVWKNKNWLEMSFIKNILCNINKNTTKKYSFNILEHQILSCHGN